MSMEHHNLFSKNSRIYAGARPLYPKEIYEYLASVCPNRKVAWDGACGNGQAANGLARYFERVEASDVSEQQIANALEHPKVFYSVQVSEKTDFIDNQFDLVCIAQALHWFDFEAFWPEVKRVLRPEGIFAAWGYSWFSIADAIDETIQEELLKPIAPYWAPQNKLLWDHYENIQFPFERLCPPRIEMNMEWNLEQLFSYLESWSAVRLCVEENGRQFFENAYDSVESLWGGTSAKKAVEMDFCMLVGRNET
jgi:SAM-dependent methyltransferase